MSELQPPPSLVIGPMDGYSPAMGRLVGMMTYARWTTLRAVEGLTTEQLDHLQDSGSNSIGALLAHIASVEVAYQRTTFDGRCLSLPAQDKEWEIAVALGDGARETLRGKPVTHYVSALEQVRAFTLAELAQRDDEWLDVKSSFGPREVNRYFMWFHVFEDELSHRGQIRWLRQRLPGAG